MMITDNQARRLREVMQQEKELKKSAMKSGMDEKTARKYLRDGRLPSEMKEVHAWRTRADPFETVWDEVVPFLKVNTGIEAKTLFDFLQRKHPGSFSDGQLRTFQRKVRRWRALEGPPKEVFFAQEHHPGRLCQSDFTFMNSLGITICGEPFDHLVYHFILTYSNWETGCVCFSESFESISHGMQTALWELGGVPEIHQTDRMSAAIQKPENPEEFTLGYRGLLDHYRLVGQYTQANSPNENGDIEQSHYRFKQAVDQALMLRGHRDFETREAYEQFIALVFKQRNSGRSKRFQEELLVLGSLPAKPLDACRRINDIAVSRGSTLRVANNTYSVDSRLIGETVDVRLYAEYFEIWYAQRCVERVPRLRGEGKHRIEYRHIIEWLLRKPGAFEHYRYRDDLFPSSRFRMAYDELKRHHSVQKAAKEYLKILVLAAEYGEAPVDACLSRTLGGESSVDSESVLEILHDLHELPDSRPRVHIQPVRVDAYDSLLTTREL